MLFLLKQQRYWKSISLAIRFVLLTEAFLQINIKLFGLILIITAFCILLFLGVSRQLAGRAFRYNLF
jgi:hypothetical protein